MGVKTHPTVDTIFQALLPEYPSLSRTTVYNTLELLREKNLVQVLDFGEGYLRYDADCSAHSHFRCDCCGTVYDIMSPPPDCSKLAPKGFSLRQVQLYMAGTCAQCSK